MVTTTGNLSTYEQHDYRASALLLIRSKLLYVRRGDLSPQVIEWGMGARPTEPKVVSTACKFLSRNF